MAVQDEADRVNFAGRLHSSQRKEVMTGTAFGKFLLVIGVVATVLTPFSGQYDDASSPHALYWVPSVIFLVIGLWIVGRPLADVFLGRVRSVNGWTNAEVDVQQRGSSSAGSRATTHYVVNIGTNTLDVSREVYARVQSGQDNTAFFTPITHRVVNVVPTRR
jgi:hypothetical protein